jgi:hypothetical protein
LHCCLRNRFGDFVEDEVGWNIPIFYVRGVNILLFIMAVHQQQQKLISYPITASQSAAQRNKEKEYLCDYIPFHGRPFYCGFHSLV